MQVALLGNEARDRARLREGSVFWCGLEEEMSFLQLILINMR